MKVVRSGSPRRAAGWRDIGSIDIESRIRKRGPEGRDAWRSVSVAVRVAAAGAPADSIAWPSTSGRIDGQRACVFVQRSNLSSHRPPPASRAATERIP
ncbi:hypothetical protein [Burkholderia sp. ABCPW 11]|uniref:hypothetical protein n=1 Tax=Burkholderia sp. ABCPW 11 TaxID=1637859 RepID=UPI000A9AF893|nr:hypothetical protein [Burkholderia sp. ABCPW 11]